MFRAHVLIIRRSKLRYTASGINTLKQVSGLKLLKYNLFVYIYTGCNRRNGPDFGRVFLMLNYTEKPQNTYIQS